MRFQTAILYNEQLWQLQDQFSILEEQQHRIIEEWRVSEEEEVLKMGVRYNPFGDDSMTGCSKLG